MLFLIKVFYISCIRSIQQFLSDIEILDINVKPYFLQSEEPFYRILPALVLFLLILMLLILLLLLQLPLPLPPSFDILSGLNQDVAW